MANTGRANYKTVLIDKVKMDKLFKQRDLSMAEASIRCGKSKWYISNQSNRGNMSESVALLLEAYYNIKPEDYAPDVKVKNVVEEKVKENISSPEIDYNKLSAAISKGVYSAITDAFDVLFDKYVKEEIDRDLPHVKSVYREIFQKKEGEV
jgi:hypothetical protein